MLEKQIGSIPPKLFINSILALFAIIVLILVIIFTVKLPSAIEGKIESFLHINGSYSMVLNLGNSNLNKTKEILKCDEIPLVNLYLDKRKIELHNVELVNRNKRSNCLEIRFSDKLVNLDHFKKNLKAELVFTNQNLADHLIGSYR